MRIFKKKQKSKFEETLKKYKIKFIYEDKNFSEVEAEINNFSDFLDNILSQNWATFLSVDKSTTINLSKVYFIEYTEIKKESD